MIYLVLVVVVAALGIARLWLQQRRQQARLFSVTEFRTGMEKISGPPPPRTMQRDRRPTTLARTSPRRAPQPLDPQRRAAAKKRIQARRSARVHAAE